MCLNVTDTHRSEMNYHEMRRIAYCLEEESS